MDGLLEDLHRLLVEGIEASELHDAPISVFPFPEEFPLRGLVPRVFFGSPGFEVNGGLSAEAGLVVGGGSHGLDLDVADDQVRTDADHAFGLSDQILEIRSRFGEVFASPVDFAALEIEAELSDLLRDAFRFGRDGGIDEECRSAQEEQSGCGEEVFPLFVSTPEEDADEGGQDAQNHHGPGIFDQPHLMFSLLKSPVTRTRTRVKRRRGMETTIAENSTVEELPERVRWSVVISETDMKK